MQLDADTTRRLKLLKLASIPLPAPSDPAKQDELTQLAAGLEADYGRGKYCPPGKPCLDINALTKTHGDAAAIRTSCSTRGTAGTPSRRR